MRALASQADARGTQQLNPDMPLLPAAFGLQPVVHPSPSKGRFWPGRTVRGALSKRSPARRTLSVAGGLLAWPGTHAPGHEQTVAAGGFVVVQLTSSLLLPLHDRSPSSARNRTASVLVSPRLLSIRRSDGRARLAAAPLGPARRCGSDAGQSAGRVPPGLVRAVR